jgi:hypothetical protein
MDHDLYLLCVTTPLGILIPIIDLRSATNYINTGGDTDKEQQIRTIS